MHKSKKPNEAGPPLSSDSQRAPGPLLPQFPHLTNGQLGSDLGFSSCSDGRIDPRETPPRLEGSQSWPQTCGVRVGPQIRAGDRGGVHSRGCQWGEAEGLRHGLWAPTLRPLLHPSVFLMGKLRPIARQEFAQGHREERGIGTWTPRPTPPAPGLQPMTDSVGQKGSE